MALTVSLLGINYSIPEPGDTGYEQSVTNYLKAIATAFPQVGGGTYPLTAELDFGSSFGIKAPYFKSATATPASTGVLRLAKTDAVAFRNNANSADINLAIDASDNLLFNGVIIAGHGVAFIGTTNGPGIVATGGSTSGDGVQGNGTGSGTGGRFQANSLTAPVRGSINLIPVSADPTAAIDGDVWISGTNPFARIGGVKKTLAALETTQTWTADQTFAGVTATSITASGAISAASVTASGTVTAGTVNATSYQQGGSPISLFASGYGSAVSSLGVGQATGTTAAPGTFMDLPTLTYTTNSLNATVSASGTITVTNAGTYLICYSVGVGDPLVAAGTPIMVSGRVVKNGTDLGAGSNGWISDSSHFGVCSGSVIVAASASDVFKVQIASGAAVASGNIGVNAVTLTVTRIS